MAEAYIDEKRRNRDEIESMEVAEASREHQWEKPSFVAELFMGRFRLSALYPYPYQDPEDKKIGDAYIEKLSRFVEENLDGDEVDREGKIPDRVVQGLVELKALALKIPAEFGGMGFSQTNYLRALEVIARRCGSTGATLSAHQSIGVPQPLLLFGTPEQKKKYLPRFAAGSFSAFALTEPEVGSDPAKMTTTATPIDNGDYYLLNGIKLWCTNGVVADVLVVMAQTPPVIVNGKEKKQITAFIVESSMPGFKVLHRCRFMGLNGIQNGLLEFKDVKVPKENIIWGLGKGLKLALITLNAGRLSLPVTCIGMGHRLLETGREWGNARKQWGAAVGEHEAGAAKLAQISADQHAMESMLWLASAWVDRDTQDIRLEAAMAKYFTSIRGEINVQELLQLRGGRGYERADSLKARGEAHPPVERWARDSRINQIVEGTNEIMSLFIAREALDRHLEIAGAVLNPRRSLMVRGLTALKAAGFYGWWYPLQWVGRGISPRYSQFGKLARHMRYVKRTSHRLALATFHQMLRHGPGLEKRQLQLRRLVDIATELFAMAASVSRAKGQMPQTALMEHVELCADVFCREARIRIRQHFSALRCNNDRAKRRLAREILAGKLKWQE